MTEPCVFCFGAKESLAGRLGALSVCDACRDMVASLLPEIAQGRCEFCRGLKPMLMGNKYGETVLEGVVICKHCFPLGLKILSGVYARILRDATGVPVAWTDAKKKTTRG